ncbi:MAG: magnesium/cobalt transporter CorA [Maribacter sp.]|nr:magnesium/cobalt transporter CorA [Maribacter sp.]
MGKKKSGLKSNKKHSKRFQKLGKAPGTIDYLGNKEASATKVTIIEFNEGFLKVHFPGNIEQIVAHKDTPTVSWVNIVGLNDTSFIEKIGKHFGLNPLTLEDIVNTEQRPKIDEYDTYIFGVFKMLYINEADELIREHVAIVLLEHCVMVFQELDDDVFNGIRERIRNQTGRVRNKSADYLFFAFMDAIIDNYFLVIEHINQNMEILDEEVYHDPRPETAHKIQQLKTEVLKIRRWVSPVKELISKLIDSESELISKDTKIFLRDVLDHATEINESLQIYREMSISLMEMYMSNISNKMNEVMKVLTIMASIFIPLTFLAGVYGMNFEFMPELQWRNGYFIILGVMTLIFVAMLLYFKRKDWL